MTELADGQLIGSYRVVKCIGRGGMGTVYEVEHVELGVHYALKTFTFNAADDSDETLKTKFLEEGKVLARLKHPNIAHVFDLGFEESSQMPYFVMDLVTYTDGESYTAADVDQSDIDEDMVYGWFKDIASALDYIHEQGIVHRDIKPGNLLIDKDLHVILTDFGISRIFGEKIKTDVEAIKTMVTKTGRGKLVMGTEKYMAPEVAQGEDATPEADAYALGVMTLRWLTGFYYGDNPGAIGLLNNCKYHWVSVIAQLVAPTPNRRPKTYSDLVKQLKPIAGANSKSQTNSKSRKKSKKRSLIVGAIMTILLLIAGGITVKGVLYGLDYLEKRNAERDKFVIALREQILKDKEEAARKEKEAKASEQARKLADEKRLAEMNREAERKTQELNLERQKLDALKREQQRASETDTNERPKSEISKPKPRRHNDEFVVTDEPADYGPIPQVTYNWFSDGGNDNPRQIEFQLANHATIELLPIKKGDYYSVRPNRSTKRCRKLTLTRPYWISKFCVTAEQWREFNKAEVSDCLPIEQAINHRYPVSKAVKRNRFDAFCKFLTQKYQSQLPKGYVFRLPSEAEWDVAVDIDATMIRYANPTDVSWHEATRINGRVSRECMRKLIQECGLNDFNRDDYKDWRALQWGWNKNFSIFIGGKQKPNATGIYDVLDGGSFLLDKVHGNTEIEYYDEAIDPLRWVEACNDEKIMVYSDYREHGCRKADEHRHLQHLVLGPDLIKEKAWNSECKNIEDDVKIPNRTYSWNPAKVQKVIKRPKEITFKLAEGGDMVFCTIPIGRFNMSNPPGQESMYHQVTLTKPFWITKYCITAKQWREYAKYDCEGYIRKVEKAFPQYPVYISFTRKQVDAFCKFLTQRYAHQLPNGYVFRLPTEAEWEWACIGDRNGDIRKIPENRYDYRNKHFQQEFEKLLKKRKSLTSDLPFNPAGYIGTSDNRIYVGGRMECFEPFGVCDMGSHLLDSILFDTYDVVCEKEDGSKEWDAFHCGNKCCQYQDFEIDPVRFAGKLSSRCLLRWRDRRALPGMGQIAFAHIVVGYDIETQLRKQEQEPYPETDFGGKLLSDHLSMGDISSLRGDPNFSQMQFKRMISTENTLIPIVDNDADLHGPMTDVEDCPWIQLDLDKGRLITGLQICIFRPWMRDHARHIRVWSSIDGKTWREIAAENDCKHIYRFDLSRKNVTAKYIRIGRERNLMHDWFMLDKVLIYGK